MNSQIKHYNLKKIIIQKKLVMARGLRIGKN
jgi:hypothetical protein